MALYPVGVFIESDPDEEDEVVWLGWERGEGSFLWFKGRTFEEAVRVFRDHMKAWGTASIDENG